MRAVAFTYTLFIAAGQWEFPSSCAWSSAEEGKDKNTKSKKAVEVPSIDKTVLRNATNNLLRNCTVEADGESISLEDIWNDDAIQNIVVSDSPIEHIFSHVRWTMYCEYIDVTSSTFSAFLDNQFVMKDGTNECRWMSEVDMQQVGITSSVKKVLAAVKLRRSQTPTKKRRKLK